MLPKTGQLENTRDGTDRREECGGWGTVEQSLVVWVLCNEVPGTAGFALPAGWSQALDGHLCCVAHSPHLHRTWFLAITLRGSLVQCQRAGALMPACLGAESCFVTFLAVPSWASS